MVGQGIATSFRKPAEREDGRPKCPKEPFTQVAIQASKVILKKEGMWLFVVKFLVQESFVPVAVLVDLVIIFL